MTYNEAYDKIITAYFKDEIKPLDKQFCFCGTLHGSKNWFVFYDVEGAPYSGQEYGQMEDALFEGIFGEDSYRYNNKLKRGTKKYEERIFKGMSMALDVLKEIHISRGEIIDEPIIFKKRELTQVI